MKKYLNVWLKTASLSVQASLAQKGGAILFTLGKFIRFGFFFNLLILIKSNVNSVSGYTLDQMVIFFLVFNLFDIFGQTFFRGIYWFRQSVLTGEFDFRLVKPMNPLFLALTRKTDILDLPLFFIILGILTKHFLSNNYTNNLLFLILAITGFILITAIHIFVAGLGVLTTEVDNTIMIYRDLSSMARVPVDIYILPIQILITFIIPIGIAYTVPAKAFLGLLNPSLFLTSLLVSVIFFCLSIKFWNYSLTKYSSASS